MLTILIVDDDCLVADVLGYGLEDAGYRVLHADSGADALALVTRERPALVITDYMMPGMNGLELASAIRGVLGGLSPPIILMSGAQAHLARRDGPMLAAVFDKPFRIAEVVARVGSLLGASR